MEVASGMDTEHTSTRLSEDERAELNWLRSENRLLRVERDMLLKIATGYANDAMARQHADPR
jgi:hypothetical protein